MFEFRPREGHATEWPAETVLFSPTGFNAHASLPGFLLRGKVQYLCVSADGKETRITLEAGDILGLECLHDTGCPVWVRCLEPALIHSWSMEAFQLYLGKDIDFAVRALSSLSRQQRKVNTEFSLRHQGIRGEAGKLLMLAQENLQAGQDEVAGCYLAHLLEAYPSAQEAGAARALILQLKDHPKRPSQMDMRQDSARELGMQTQMILYNLAFYGVSAISTELFGEFGRTCPAGETLFQEGDAGDELFLILKGSVDVYKEGMHLACLGEAAIFGEMALFEGKPRSATVIVRESLEMLALNRDEFKMVFQLHPNWTWQLLQGFALRIANTYHLLANLGAHGKPAGFIGD